MARRAVAALLVLVSGLGAAQEPAKPPAEPVVFIERSTTPPPCIIKPVMTDDELRACGARIPK